MTLPVPNLDDRRFQDLVDDAKRMVQQRCPEWSDHNVSDPGVTLIETFAFMVDQLLYRLNRVPDRLYISYLDLLGITLHPATAARVDVTAWLSAPQEEDVTIPAGSEVATMRTDRDEATVFATVRDLVVPPRHVEHVLTQEAERNTVWRSEELSLGNPFRVFSAEPQLGDCMLLGLDEAAPSIAVVLRFDCQVEGVGVDPDWPPLQWEAWTGTDWSDCEVDRDSTGGLNRPGDVVLHLPENHTTSIIENLRAGWIRCRVVEPIEGYPVYSASPTISSASGFAIGGTVPAVHAETIHDETIGLSEGVPGQVFKLQRGPVVGEGPPFVVEVAGGQGWDQWTEVSTFAGCGPDDRVVRVDRSAGEVHFGPAVREQDGTLCHYGAVPPKATPLRVPAYRTGGGPHGNVAAGAIRVLRTTIPLVDRVENRRAAIGGIAAETIEQAKVRGPMALRTRDRAVTPEDYEQLARNAAQGITRVRCMPAQSTNEAGGVRVLVVPAASADVEGRLRFEDLVPDAELLETVADYINDRRTVGARVMVEPPFYQGVTVVAKLVSRARTAPDELHQEALKALNRYFDPLVGGPDGNGWPFGRPVQSGEVYAVLQRLPGTELVDEVKLFPADPITGKRGQATQRIDLDRFALVFSYEHQIKVTKGL